MRSFLFVRFATFVLVFLMMQSAVAGERNYFEEAALLKRYPEHVKKVDGGYKVNCNNKGFNMFLRDSVLLKSNVESIAQVVLLEEVVGTYLFDDYFDKIGYLGFWFDSKNNPQYRMVSLRHCTISGYRSKPNISTDGKLMIVDSCNDGAPIADRNNNLGVEIFDVNLNAAIHRDVVSLNRQFDLDHSCFHSWTNPLGAKFRDVNSSWKGDFLENFIMYYDSDSKGWMLKKSEENFSEKILPKEKNIDRKMVEEFESDKQLALKILDKHPNNIKFISSILRDDKDVIKLVVSKPGLGRALEYASERLRDDDEIAMIALLDNPGVFSILSKRLRGKRDFVDKIIQKSPFELRYASDELKNDKDLMRSVVLKSPALIDIFPNKFRDDDEFMRSLIEMNADLLMFSSESLRDNKDLVVKVIPKSTTEEVFQSLSERLKKDPEILRMAKDRYPEYYDFKDPDENLSVDELKKKYPVSLLKNKNDAYQPGAEININDYSNSEIKAAFLNADKNFISMDLVQRDKKGLSYENSKRVTRYYRSSGAGSDYLERIDVVNYHELLIIEEASKHFGQVPSSLDIAKERKVLRSFITSAVVTRFVYGRIPNDIRYHLLEEDRD